MNKAEFLRTVRTKRAHLEENLQFASEEQLVERTTLDGWSIKDGLAHLTFYEQHMLNQVRLALKDELKILPLTATERISRNARIFAANQDRPLADVLAEMQRSFSEVMALVESIPDPILTDPAHFRGWLNGMPLWQYIMDETSGEHYEEHLGHLME